MAAGQNAGFGFSPKLKAKKYHMSGTLHLISLALILYQTQQMFKGKPNTQTHNSHKSILIISGRQTIYSSEVTKKEYEHMPLHSVCLTSGFLNSFCWESHH